VAVARTSATAAGEGEEPAHIEVFNGEFENCSFSGFVGEVA